MTPTLKEQIEQWIEREADNYEASLEREIKYLSENDIDHRYTDNALDDFKAGAHSILPMLLVALEALEFVINHSMPSTYNNEEAHKVLNKIKSMMEGNGND
jgi:hypothetical protein